MSLLAAATVGCVTRRRARGRRPRVSTMNNPKKGEEHG